MIKGSNIRKADHPIEQFLIDRWSPRAMSGEEISEEELMRLFEPARWAPSSFNAQQWRALYARRGTEHWQTFFDQNERKPPLQLSVSNHTNRSHTHSHGH